MSAASPGGALRRIAFIGIGNMGWPMAARLVGAGFDVVVCDVAAERSARFATEVGGEAAADAATAARGADAVITILPTSKHVGQAIEAMGDALSPGALLIEMSSGVPTATRGFAEALTPRGVAMIDAPVSGGVPRARSGELAIMLGGEAADVARADAVLRAMGNNLTHVGGIGAGQAMKALNNLMGAAGFLIGVEALLIGQRFGLDPAQMVDVLNNSTGMNNSTQKKFKQFVLSRRFDAGFGLELMAKDVSVALEVAKETGTPVPFAALCREMWASAVGLLGPGMDHTAMAQFSEKLVGETLGGGNRAS
ncbi:NAD(P)-dependent oxidoreductase [Pseudoroseomonas cervicalis]|uniref:NAD(P)-dependent oxidoreductase n=1 Tax=Teichococcus cervicalis TaxID=204525 RepID=UPI00278B6CB1|nr:NAD(P)-dependent oxidoreductase [Pseudoroseomonas cervicalis]MDQ1081856.1 3-hydroxyisobutyrate dehydrogenase [Pseudoroseomonas cervicalis]